MFCLVLVLGFLFRVVISFAGHHGDISSYFEWGKEGYVRGFSDFYQRDFSSRLVSPANYPPLNIFLYSSIYGTYQLIRNSIMQLNVYIPIFPSQLVYVIDQENVVLALFKLPAILADMGIALLFFVYGHQKKLRNLLLWSVVFVFNPVLWYNSALWGQLDSIPIFLLLLSLYVGIVKEKPFISVLFFVAGFLIKQSLIIFIPLYFIVSLKRHGLYKSIIQLLFFFSVCVVSAVLMAYTLQVLFITSSTDITGYAFNFWSLFFPLQGASDLQPFITGINFQQTGYTIFSITYIVVLLSFRKKKIVFDHLLLMFMVVAFSAFMFLTRLHERHFLAVIPLLGFVLVTQAKQVKVYVVLSVFHILNLVYVWNPITNKTMTFLFEPWSYRILAFTALVFFFYLFRNLFIGNEEYKK